MKTVYKVFQYNNLVTYFISITSYSLKIALTLPVSSDSTERTFSKLKIIKSKLRTTMAQERLLDLMIISCERDISDTSDMANL